MDWLPASAQWVQVLAALGLLAAFIGDGAARDWNYRNYSEPASPERVRRWGIVFLVSGFLLAAAKAVEMATT